MRFVEERRRPLPSLGSTSVPLNFRRASLSWVSTAALLCVCIAFQFNPLCATNAERRDQNPADLVRAVMRTEIDTQLHDDSLWCFRELRQDDGKARKTLEVCQTRAGDIERLVSIDGQEISASERDAEELRVEKLIEHPEQLRAKQKKQHEDQEQMRNLMKLFPDAFQFQYASFSGDLVNLSFRPNPGFRPSTRMALVFHHMEGNLVVDSRQNRVVEINGRLTSPVKFGAGLLGHLDEGGTFLVRDREVAPQHWDTTLLNININGKVLFFKTIAIQQNETYSNYTRVPAGITLQQTAELLKMKCSRINTASSH